MSAAPQREVSRMSLEAFRSFCAQRPDEEQWELIDGVATMMTPPTVAHQMIGSNLHITLDRALAQHRPELIVLQRLGVNLAPGHERYDPEPDIAIVDATAAQDPGRRYVDRFYLAAEIVSESDRNWVDKKRELYKLQETCRCVLIVQQNRWEVRLDRRGNAGLWTEQVLTRPDDVIEISEFDFRCRLSDLYQGTALHPKR